MKGIEGELKKVISKYIKENKIDIPDQILCEYLVGCLNAFIEAMEKKQYYTGDREI